MIKKILKSSLFKASGIYTIFSILNSAIPFFLLPILTRYLTPEDYGILALFNIFVSISGVFVGLSVHGAVNRVFFDKKYEFKIYVANSLIILFVSSIIFLLFVYLFRDLVEKIFSISLNWAILAVFISFFQFIIFVLLSIYQAHLKAKNYGLINLSLTIFNLILSILLIVYLGFKWEGRVLAQLIAAFSIGTISFYILYKNWTEFKIKFEYIHHALKFGIPLIPHTIGGMLITMSDRLIIEHLLDVHAVGIYTVGLQIGSIISLLATAFNKAYAPWLFDKLNKNDFSTKLKIVKFTYIYFLLIFLLALLFGFIAPFFMKIIVGKEFYESSSIVLWIALGGAFNGMYYMVTNYIFFTYKTYYLAFITFFIGFFNLLVTFFLVKYYGIKGGAYAFSLTMFFQFLFTWILSMKVYKMPWNMRII